MPDGTPQGDHPAPGSRRRGRDAGLRAMWQWVRQAALGAAIALLFSTYVLQGYRVEGASMEPTLHDHERVFVNKFAYRVGDVRRGDIVVFWYPSDPSKNFIKRVIGLPGDWVWIQEGRVYVNGTALREGYVTERDRRVADMAPRRVPPGHYFVLGDHRSNSSDSRSWGFVPRRYIQGRAFYRFWPPDAAGQL